MSEYFVDEDPIKESTAEEVTLHRIAINRSWAWMQEYDQTTGRVGVKDSPYINEQRHAFIDGFIEGFQARFFKQND